MTRPGTAIRQTQCRLCGSGLIPPWFDLGDQPLANGLCTSLVAALQAPAYPLAVTRCPVCESVQLTHDVPSDLMFADYPYRTGASAFFRAHFDALAEEVTAVCGQGHVIDIGCNDGTLLAAFKRRGWRVEGVEPCLDLVDEAVRAHGIIVRPFPWTASRVDVWSDDGRPWADVITACNVFAHVPDLRDFLAGVRKALKPDGLFIFEVYYLPNLLRDGAFDTFYHEHIYTHHVRPLDWLLRDHGFSISRVVDIPTHGGSIRVWARNSSKPPASIHDVYDRERKLSHTFVFTDFRLRTHLTVDRIRDAVLKIRSEGRRVIGYTAPAKATVMLNAAGIGSGVVEYVVDDAPSKQGKWIPGVGIPVVGRERMATDTPDVAILFSWTLPPEEILSKLPAGCSLLIPLPELKIISR